MEKTVVSLIEACAFKRYTEIAALMSEEFSKKDILLLGAGDSYNVMIDDHDVFSIFLRNGFRPEDLYVTHNEANLGMSFQSLAFLINCGIAPKESFDNHLATILAELKRLREFEQTLNDNFSMLERLNIKNMIDHKIGVLHQQIRRKKKQVKKAKFYSMKSIVTVQQILRDVFLDTICDEISSFLWLDCVNGRSLKRKRRFSGKQVKRKK